MTAPGNRRRDGNDRAFAVRDRVHQGAITPGAKHRNSPYGRRLAARRERP